MEVALNLTWNYALSDENESYYMTGNVTQNTTTATSVIERVRSKCALEWQVYVKLVFIPLFLLIGLVGNSISFTVMCTKTYRRKSYSYYLRALAVFDTLSLLCIVVEEMHGVSHKLEAFNFELFKPASNAACKAQVFFQHTVQLISSWLVVSFTIDRFVAVCYPLQRAYVCTERVAITVLSLMLLLMSAAQCYHIIYISYEPMRPQEACFAYGDKEFMLKYFTINYFTYNLLLYFVPFVIIMVCNNKIICHIVRMKKVRVTEQRTTSRRANLAIYTLHAVCITFTLTLLPNAALSFTQYVAIVFFSYRELLCTLRQLSAPFQVIRLINYSCNFILYGLTGRRFRTETRELMSAITSLCSCCQRAMEESATGENIPIANLKVCKNSKNSSDSRKQQDEENKLLRYN